MTKKVQPPAGEAPAPASCRVWDKNAGTPNPTNPKKDGARTHDIEGCLYPLYSHGPGTEVPLKHAIFFLKDPSFVVRDGDGNLLEHTKPSDADTTKLLPHQTVATYQELSIDALLVRVRRLPGGAKLSKHDGKSKLIEFLMAGGLENVERKKELDRVTAMKEGEDDDAGLVDDEDDESAAFADQVLAAGGAR